MIGIVVVSHSAALADAAIAVALAMVPEGSRPVVLAAAGLPDGGLGTDAASVAEAVGEADDGEGVLLLVDLGSAVLSAEMGLEFCSPEVAARAVISAAPLVEGLVAAVVAAASGVSVAECDVAARRGSLGKEEHLGVGGADTHPCHAGDAGVSPVDVTKVSVGPPTLTWSTTIDLPQGLHARPAASVALALAGLDAQVMATNPRTGATADASSPVELMGLDLREGDVLEATITGTDAAAARSALDRAAAGRFGELR